MTAGACGGTRSNGNPCRAKAARSSDYCMWHDPDREIDRDIARTKTQITLNEYILQACRFALRSPEALTRDQLRAAKEMQAKAADFLHRSI